MRGPPNQNSGHCMSTDVVLRNTKIGRSWTEWMVQTRKNMTRKTQMLERFKSKFFSADADQPLIDVINNQSDISF